MGTAKRERKKSNREMGRQAQESAAKRQKTTKLTVRIVGAVVVILALFFGIAFLTNDDSNDATSPITTIDPNGDSIPVGDATTVPGDSVPSETVPAVEFVYGETM